MKIRLDFVTNSSSSSFILGRPSQNTVTVADGHKYLKKAQNKIGVKGDVYCEHFIDLRYDPTHEYTSEEVMMVIEALCWYTEHEERDKMQASGIDYLTAFEEAKGVEALVTDDGECFEIDEYQETYPPERIKAIFDYAYEHLGEVLLGSIEMPFTPYKIFDDVILEDKSIKYKCNHMG